ncbi:hypothetical protein DNTS_004150, partial [Danionella cerebrum]
MALSKKRLAVFPLTAPNLMNQKSQKALRLRKLLKAKNYHHGEMVLTKEMEEEEKRLVEESEKKERELMDEARKSWEKDSRDIRFKRLQHLLEKSNIYSNDTNTDIKSRLSESLRESSKQQLDPERTVNGQPVPAQQPRLLTGGVMRWYQVEGIEWLRMLWENGINGILADEMGLGKTIQCIAHIAMMVERKVPGPFLVVAPLSTLPNWISEFKRFTPDVSVMLYHGNPKERFDLNKKICKKQGPLGMCPVVVTSFEIAMIDRKMLQRFHWKYLIVDEGHRIKNLNCRLVRELKMVPTDNKLLLTGTPLQNNLSELWSLLNFLLPDVFDDLKSFESWFDISTITADAENIVA